VYLSPSPSPSRIRTPSLHDALPICLAFYGYTPSHAQAPGLRIGMSVYARVMQVKTVRAGDTVGYGRTWTAHEDRRIATVAMGYRSEEHTSELQSRENLVCRLLLEKK